MPVLFNDYDFGKARQEEIQREAEAVRLVKKVQVRQHSKPGVRDRMLVMFGNILIDTGWKIKEAGACSYPCSEPSRS
ncbi:MAG: hypothetical protein ACK2U3_12375 [Anaerolineales bacterium]|jgi:hypothetical protein